MSVALKQFVQQLTSIDLLSADELRPFVERLGQERDAKAAERLAKELICEKKLTAFQAQAALQGKAKNLVLGNYLILETLGQGGMGMVLKARHKRMDRVVALKILSAKALQSPDAIKRFEREVRAAAKLHHPNIVTAFDADEAHGTHFLVMEYVEGKNLSLLIKETGPFPVAQAIECILQAARGLEYAHQRGIVHRDIKPANLLLSVDGKVKILDMGLARLESVAGDQAELTGTGQIMGTVDYMAPEQAVNTKHADQRADIYSLGITLWYLLTGKAAYEGDTLMAKLVAHREQPIPSFQASGMGALAGEIGERIDRVFQKMVAKRPEDRYSSMTHVITDLLRCESDRTTAPTISLGPGEDSKLSEFLRNVGGAAPLAVPPIKTTPKPATHVGLQETIVAGASEGDTEPSAIINLAPFTAPSEAVSRRRESWLRDWRVRVAAIGSVVGLSLVLAFVLSGVRYSGRTNEIVAQNDPENSRQPAAAPRDIAAPAPPAPQDAAPSDLISQIDPSRDALEGVWQRTAEGLVSPVLPYAQLALPGSFPPEYRLTLVVIREAGSGPLVIGFPMNGKRTVLTIDASGNRFLLGDIPVTSGEFRGLDVGKSVSVELVVQRASLIVTSDGEQLLRITRSPAEPPTSPRWATQDPNVPFVGTSLSRFRITKLELSPLASGRSN